MNIIIRKFGVLGISIAIVFFGFMAVSVAYATPIGTSATWVFDLPSTALASQHPPYPEVANLTLTQTAAGVQFLLTPNSSSPGFNSDSFIQQLDYVYKGPDLTGGSPGSTAPSTINDFRWDSGAPIKLFDEPGGTNIDSGYKANDRYIEVRWADKKTDADRFLSTQFSEWTVLASDLTDFTGTFATSNSKPTPIQGVISVTAYSLPDPKPTPSNWVTSVPEPTTMLLLGCGLAGLIAGRKILK